MSDMYRSIQNDDKFITRLQRTKFKKEQSQMLSDDEVVEIENQYDRLKYYKTVDPELYDFYQSGQTIKVRFVNIELSTGEIETLLTNLDADEFSKEELSCLYQMRWAVETNYHYLKESMKSTNISSSETELIKQDIYSQMFVFNMLQAVQNEVTENIDQDKYKHKMKVNMNMAVGYIKRYFIVIMITDESDEIARLYDELHEKILKNIVPIRKGRKYERTANTKNKHHINKRKAF